MKRIALAAMAAIMLLIPATSRAQHFSSRGLTYRDPEALWVDSVMRSLTLEQRIAQLMIVRVPLNMDDKQTRAFSQTMNGYGVGGVCFFAGTAERQVPQTKRLQRDANVPLLVCIDGEWGLGMRLKDMYSFPKNDRFGRLEREQDSIVFRMGAEIGRQCREMGIHVNFAPVADINSNPRNPVIGTRSFGTNRERVSELGIMYALGQQSQGVLATAKHFPGHGDTETDSHLELPVINHTREYIDSIDTYPFRRMIEAGVGGVMVAHLQVNALDSERPSSLSPTIVDGLLRHELGFEGIIVTDGLDMKGVTNTYGHGRGELAALLAGNDLLLLPPNVPEGIAAIKEAALNSDSVRALVDWHCRRVLKAKYHLVVPHLNEDIAVPGTEHTAVCNAIVNDLNINIDRRIDSLVQRAIAAHATPGCQIAVMHGGRMVLNKGYGHTTYDTLRTAGGAAAIPPTMVDSTTLYDLASLTKVCATTLAIMKLVDQGEIGINDKMSKHLPYLKGTNKERMSIKEVMSHCARLQSFNPYWKQTSNHDSLLLLVAQSPLNEREGYVYSDLGFILLCDLVQRVSGEPLEVFVARHFYEPMGLQRTLFNPLQNGYTGTIAPTEADTLRGSEAGYIIGTVHDPNAYALGGVSGHAGLFSTAGDVARLMQMLLNGGELNGHRYLKEKTVATFTSRHFEKQNNRRALGFDKQLFTPSKSGQTCIEATQASFGHTGFTGTMVWVDPEYDLVYVFLSNRVHPSAEVNKLAQMNTRTDIQSAIYSDILK